MTRKRDGLLGAIAIACIASGVACSGGANSPGEEEPTASSSDSLLSLCLLGGSLIPVDPYKELMIVHPSVVKDPVLASNAQRGHLSFRYAIEEMVPAGVDASDFVRSWLEQIGSVQDINGFHVEPRGTALAAFLDGWPKTATGKLDLAQAPFDLLAVVNRIDSRSAAVPLGEGRFVYGARAADGTRMPFTIIFEYAPPGTLQDVGSYSARWHDLAILPFGLLFNLQLTGTTDFFAARGRAPAKPNGSAIRQIRTNERAFGDTWQMREFRLSAADGLLHQSVLAQQPDLSLNDDPRLVSWVNANASAVVAKTAPFPAEFAAASVDSSPATAWQLTGVAPNVRTAFAKQTCNGCHTLENPPIDGFYHVSPLTAGGPDGKASLSPFVKNTALNDRKKSYTDALCGKTILGDVITIH